MPWDNADKQDKRIILVSMGSENAKFYVWYPSKDWTKVKVPCHWPKVLQKACDAYRHQDKHGILQSMSVQRNGYYPLRTGRIASPDKKWLGSVDFGYSDKEPREYARFLCIFVIIGQ